MITVAEVNAAMSRPKFMVAPMSWIRPLQRGAGWLNFVSAMAFDDDPTVTPEGLAVRGQWAPKGGDITGGWSFGMFYRGERVYAVDVMPASRHANRRAGAGRPQFGKTVAGIHEHTWSTEGYGYAEELVDPAMDNEASSWALFAARAGIVRASFVHPDKAVEQGQGGLWA